MPPSRGRLTPARIVASMLIAAMLLVPVAALLLVRRFMPNTVTTPARGSAASSASSAAKVAPDRTPEIRGWILDADGEAVRGSTVRLLSARAPYTVLAEARSDGQGGFSFAHVPPGRARVVADHDPEGVVASADLRAAEGETTEVSLVLSAAIVRGTVVDEGDHALAGAAIAVEGVPWATPTASSDPAGAFRLATVPREATSLVAVARGFKIARVALARPEDGSELVLRIRLDAALPVEGDVRDDGGNPVVARIVACAKQPYEARTESAADGTFKLPPSTIGCDAVAVHDDYGPSDAAAVAEGRRISLRLKAGGAIEGVVVDERGAAIPSFTVGIESFAAATAEAMAGRRGGGARSFEDLRGSFRLEKLAPGSYVLTASAPGKPPTRSDSIDVAGGIAPSRVRIVLGPGGTVTGHVYDERHAGVSGADVRFDAVSSVLESTASAKTDETGQYRLEGAPPGLFTLRVQKDGFRLRMVSGLRVDARGALTQDLTLTAIDGGGGMEFGGIGATLAQTREGISIGSAMSGDPADRADLHAGDRILRIDGDDTEGMSMADVLQRLRGQPGTSVGVSVLRTETGETADVVVVRASIVR